LPLLGSASKLHRTIRCPASNLLPQVAELSEKVIVAGNRGTALHRYLQLAPESEEEALAAIPEQYHAEARTIPLSACAGTRTPPELREVAMVHNLETEECRQVICKDREYGELADEDIPGTADVVIVGFRTAEIWDYKTGSYPVQPEDNYQLLDAALKTARTLARQATHIVCGIQQFKNRGRGEKKKLVPQTKATVVDRFDLDAHEHRAKKALALAREVKEAIDAGETPPVRKGPWCLFCPAKPGCPAW
jgi:hypothetical protein